mmetsp:Transcript_15818/g.47525  ORF Transcript_15818/g.47525 Transcript_15818/m.47525 type:complete len:380 (+) Transcript_15818:66-1205(+)
MLLPALPPPWSYHFAHAPGVFYFFWSAGAAAAVGSWAVAVRQLRQHLSAAGTEDFLFLSEDSKKAVIISCVAPICATIQFTTLLSPRSALSIQLLAACVQSFAQLSFVSYMMHLLGGPNTAVEALGRLRAKWWAWLVPSWCGRCGLQPCCSQEGFSSKQFRLCYYLSIQNALLVPVITLVASQAKWNGDGGSDACGHIAFNVSQAFGHLSAVSTVAAVLSMQTLRRAVGYLLEPSAGNDRDADPLAGRWNAHAAAAEGFPELVTWPGFKLNAKFRAMKAAVLVSGLTSSICSSSVRQGYSEPVAAVCGGCPCYDRIVMAQSWAAFATVVALLPVALLAARAYPVEPAVARARDVLCLVDALAARRPGLGAESETVRFEA